MGTTLCLLRHGRASGQGPNARLLPEGEEHVAALGRRLAREGLLPVRAFSSPYVRAVETARIVLAHVAPGLRAETLPELVPECDPNDTIAALAELDLPAARVLVVAHLPLLALVAQKLAREVVAFSPGTLAEIELDESWSRGRVERIIEPQDAAD
jgi:phosphohistidine phosphatase SixA